MEIKGKIGIFDSGLGGLWMLKHIREMMPEYDYVFFGDQAYVPYGNKTNEELLERAKKIFSTLFNEYNCTIILLACNTTSTTIFKELQSWIREIYPDKHIWGLVPPTIEAIPSDSKTIFFGTHRTIMSHVYKTEMEKRGALNVEEIELPELATRIEQGEETGDYIKTFNNFLSTNEYIGVLVCTHYGIVREDFRGAFPNITKWIYQEEIIPKYIQAYFISHPELEKTLSNGGIIKIIVSKENDIFNKWLMKWYGEKYTPTILSL